MIERVAQSNETVLIQGESGTGKELVAQAIHACSPRKDNMFMAVNCAALPAALLESEMFGHVKGAFTGAISNKKGLLEAAEKGTIFLDEIGTMPLTMQAKFLRVLQEKELRRVGGNEIITVEARVLAATNVPLEDLVRNGQFREDLYYRLNVIPIVVDPLRRRKEDILPLARHIVQAETPEGKKTPDMSEDMRDMLERYTWPGNVRELQNAIKHALTFARGDTITGDVLPPGIVRAVAKMEIDDGTGFSFIPLKEFVRMQEQEYIQQVMDALGGNKEKAAKALKVSLATFYRRLPGSDRGIEPA